MDLPADCIINNKLMSYKKRRKLAQDCTNIERQIWKTFSEAPRFPVCNDDWTDAHQEALEFQWFKDEINQTYIEAQKKLFEYLDSLGFPHRQIRTAQQYYNRRKRFEKRNST